MVRPYSRTVLDIPTDIDHPIYGKVRSVWIPTLNVRVSKKHGPKTPFRIPVVVDSGSPYCMFRADVAAYLGINLDSCPQEPIGGIITGHGMTETAYFHPVQLYIEMDWIIGVTAAFVKRLAVPGILGRDGFFDRFYVRFDHSVSPPTVEVTKIERPN